MDRRHGDPLLSITTLQETASMGQWLAENSDWDFTPSSTTATLFFQRRGLLCVWQPCIPIKITLQMGYGCHSTSTSGAHRVAGTWCRQYSSMALVASCLWGSEGRPYMAGLAACPCLVQKHNAGSGRSTSGSSVRLWQGLPL